MVYTKVIANAGSAEQRSPELKRGKGKAGLAPMTSIEVLTPATLSEPVAAQAVVDAAFDFFVEARRQEMEKIRTDPTY